MSSIPTVSNKLREDFWVTGICVTSRNEIILADPKQDHIVVCHSDKTVKFSIRIEKPLPIPKSIKVAVFQDTGVIVVLQVYANGNKYLQLFTREGKFIRRFIVGLCEDYAPAMTVDDKGNIIVVYGSPHRVFICDVYSIVYFDKMWHTIYTNPIGVIANGQFELFISDALTNAVKVCHYTGQVLRTVGEGMLTGALHGVAFSPSGQLLVVHDYPQTITCYDQAGDHLPANYKKPTLKVLPSQRMGCSILLIEAKNIDL